MMLFLTLLLHLLPLELMEPTTILIWTTRTILRPLPVSERVTVRFLVLLLITMMIIMMLVVAVVLLAIPPLSRILQVCTLLVPRFSVNSPGRTMRPRSPSAPCRCLLQPPLLQQRSTCRHRYDPWQDLQRPLPLFQSANTVDAGAV
jgi:hypothetical protein